MLLSSEARNYKKTVSRLASLHVKKPLEEEVSMVVHLYRPRKAGDLTNFFKTLDDTLQGVCYVNDSQIVEYHAHRHDDKDNPRVEVTITPHTPL